MPDTIQFENGNQIVNTYNASGRKLKTQYFTVKAPVVVPLGNTLQLTYKPDSIDESGTVYDGQFEYAYTRNAPVLAGHPRVYRVHNPEGYAVRTQVVQNSWNVYNYYRRDHLGNNCAVWDATNDTTLQQTVYYASGLPMAVSSGQSTQPYKYNGKEFIEMHGLDVTDLGFRSVHNARGRFDNMDPLCEQAYHSSPYAISANNPVNNVDVLGLASTNFGSYGNFGSLNWTVLDSNGNVVGHKNDPNDTGVYMDPTGNWKEGDNLSSLTLIGFEFEGISKVYNRYINNMAIKDVSIALSTIGISSDMAHVYTKANAGEQIVYVTLEGTTAVANVSKVLKVLKGISTATIIVGVVVDAVHVAVDPSYLGKAIVNTGVTVVATIIGSTLSVPAGLVIGGGYLILDQFGAFDRPTNLPYYNNPVCPQDNTRINVPYK